MTSVLDVVCSCLVSQTKDTAFAESVNGYRYATKSGIFKHPTAINYLTPDPTFVSVLEGPDYPSKLDAMTIRLRKHYLPLIAVLFETKENLRAGKITKRALERADLICLAFWHSARELYAFLPETKDEEIPQKIASKVREMTASGFPNIPVGKLASMVWAGRNRKEFAGFVEQAEAWNLIQTKRIPNASGVKVEYVTLHPSSSGVGKPSPLVSLYILHTYNFPNMTENHSVDKTENTSGTPQGGGGGGIAISANINTVDKMYSDHESRISDLDQYQLKYFKDEVAKISDPSSADIERIIGEAEEFIF